MTIEEFKSILNDDSMQQKQTNIKIVENKTTTGRMTIAQVHQEVVQLKDIVIDFIKEQREFNQSVLKKFDQYDRLFKKHGWIK